MKSPRSLTSALSVMPQPDAADMAGLAERGFRSIIGNRPDGEEPVLVNNLVRMSQGKMMGVDFNREKTWVGSTIGLHRSAA